MLTAYRVATEKKYLFSSLFRLKRCFSSFFCLKYIWFSSPCHKKSIIFQPHYFIHFLWYLSWVDCSERIKRKWIVSLIKTTQNLFLSCPQTLQSVYLYITKRSPSIINNNTLCVANYNNIQLNIKNENIKSQDLYKIYMDVEIEQFCWTYFRGLN